MYVVRPDKDGNHVWIDVQCVGLPPFLHVVDGVAGNSPIEKQIVALRVQTQKMGRTHLHISMSEDMVHVAVTSLLAGLAGAPAVAPASVGDGVADEEDAPWRLLSRHK